ncbi:hypothetical protein [Sessilibacter corallicola]|uniref:hypothetical protein n=1 Tax=Sessilibacter corallicola TaxID=2904075 RepID=UPI001E4096E5|nr:hypothetical protein [Sessilibacter corallicola]MCE2027544.1 hypothetical protein [Sessilibacter corallicola]
MNIRKKVHSFIRIFFVIITCAGAVGCATTGSNSSAPIIPGQEQGQATGSKTPPPPAQAPVNSTSRVIDDLLAKGKRALSSKQPMLAIEQAERGIRIDRTEPELYLLLARAYDALGEVTKAANFARQGLRYVSNSQFLLKQKLQKFTEN